VFQAVFPGKKRLFISYGKGGKGQWINPFTDQKPNDTGQKMNHTIPSEPEPLKPRVALKSYVPAAFCQPILTHVNQRQVPLGIAARFNALTPQRAQLSPYRRLPDMNL
jgi:hypothetical protein